MCKEVDKMRLLISISFEDKTKDSLTEIMGNLKNCSRKGRFLDRDNLRMDFLLLHAIEDIQPIQKNLDKLELTPFNIHFTRIDRSRREGGDIYWAVAEENTLLDKIYNSLKEIADAYEYDFEDKPFKPRVQLGYSIIARPDFQFNGFDATVSNITVLRCIKAKGKEIYKELYRKNF